jgi:ketosteroid isomerase-like protein
MRRAALTLLLCTTSLLLSHAQSPTPPSPGDPLTQQPAINSVTAPTLSPGQLELIKLEGQFSEDVGKRGGVAFASWFADDAVTLNNGKPAVLGRIAIAAKAQWDPREYHLSWYAEGAQMGPSGDTGFTWGHYDATSHDAHGQPVTLSGRYITFWKKVAGQWKVALDASADEPPNAGACCTLPQP